MMTINENNLFSLIVKGSLLLLAALTAAAAVIYTANIGASVLIGGIIAIVNFYWMRSVLRRILGLQPDNPGSYAQMRFLARITTTGVVLYFVIVSGHFSILGLIAGLSVIVINIIILSIYCALRTGG